MNLLEEAIIYATVLHQGRTRRMSDVPYILHPLEVAQILSTMTDDLEVLAAGVLHDVVEDTDGTLAEIERRFGERVAGLVASTTEAAYVGVDKALSWKRRKEESLRALRNSTDVGVKMLWLADKLANIRSTAGSFSERGEAVWEAFHQRDPEMQRWYYESVAKLVEFDLNRSGAYKEFIKHINFIWPGTFASEKTRYKKYREVSIEGCRLIGRGSKGDVYRYDEELIVKVYHEGITFQEVEREIELNKTAFILGLPTTISFGIVAVGHGYGAMSELVDSPSLSDRIARSPGQVGYVARIMADLARQIHDTEADKDAIPQASDMMRERVRGGLMHEDPELAERVLALIDAIPVTHRLTHGDFHTGNVLLMEDEPVLIDMDRLAYGPPIEDLSGLYMAYVAYGEEDPAKVEGFMGFGYETALQFWRLFLERYLDTQDEERIQRVTDRAALLCYARMVRQAWRQDDGSAASRGQIARLVDKVRTLLGRVDELTLA